MTDAAAAPAALPDEPGKSARALLLDHLGDTVEAGPQSRQQLLEAMPGADRNTVDQALFRAVEAEEIERVDRGLYKLAPPKPKPPAAPPPPAEPERVREGHSDSEWFALIAAYHATGVWNQERDGLPPDVFGNRVPLDIIMRLNHRQREAERAAEKAALKAAQKAAEEAAAEKAAAPTPKLAAPALEDAALFEKLLQACDGNVVHGDAIKDLTVVRAMLAFRIEFDDLWYTCRAKVSRRAFPGNKALSAWSEPKFMRAVAETYLRRVVVPAMVETWLKAACGEPAARVKPLAAVSAP